MALAVKHGCKNRSHQHLPLDGGSCFVAKPTSPCEAGLRRPAKQGGEPFASSLRSPPQAGCFGGVGTSQSSKGRVRVINSHQAFHTFVRKGRGGDSEGNCTGGRSPARVPKRICNPARVTISHNCSVPHNPRRVPLRKDSLHQLRHRRTSRNSYLLVPALTLPGFADRLILPQS